MPTSRRPRGRLQATGGLNPFFSTVLSHLIDAAPAVREPPETLSGALTVSSPSSENCHNPLPLPVELWPRIFSHLTNSHHLGQAAEVCTTWNSELTTPRADPIWRSVWDAGAVISAKQLLEERPWAMVGGRWRDQVAASRYLALLPKFHDLPSCKQHSSRMPRLLHVPPRYGRDGLPCDADALRIRPGQIDIDEVLGSAVAAQAFGSGVFIAFENGIGLLSAPGQFSAARARVEKTRDLLNFYYDDSPLVAGIELLARRPAGPCGYIIATTSSKNVLRIEVTSRRRGPTRDKGHASGRLLEWTVIDTFDNIDGSVVEVVLSEGDGHALIGLSTGEIRMVNIIRGNCERVFTMSECPELIAGNKKWVVAANSFQPIGAAVWDATDERIVHSFSRASVGWEEIVTIAGLTATRWEDIFAIWNGYDSVRLLDVKRGTFTRLFKTESQYTWRLRSVNDEGEEGSTSPHLGRGKMILSADGTSVIVASSNRVFRVELCNCRTPAQLRVDQVEAKRALLAVSTDERILLTAESRSYGGLACQVNGKASLARNAVVQLWTDIRRGSRGRGREVCEKAAARYNGHVPLPCPATSISVCGVTVAVVCENGQVVVAFARPA